MIPFGGFKEDAVTLAFQLYQKQSTDLQTYLIDLGASAQVGLNAKGPSRFSGDGVHPLRPDTVSLEQCSLQQLCKP